MPIRVLIVDDSAFMRAYLSRVLGREPDLEVHTARDGEEALRLIPALQPDVITLDVQMPRMDGLTCLRQIMQRFPRPVIMVSSLTQRGAWQTLEALGLGAVDCVPKPAGAGRPGESSQWAAELVEKVRAASRARLWTAAVSPPPPSIDGAPQQPGHRAGGAATMPAAVPATTRFPAGLVLIGASTGGPRAVEEVVSGLPEGFPLAVLVAQHMPPGFTQAFAQRLARRARLSVQEVNGPMPLRAGEVLIARGGFDMVVAKDPSGQPVAVDVPEDPAFRWHPSVERMVRSAMELYPPSQLIAVQLTGMGSDGAEAMAELHRRGGFTVAESEQTAVIFGMPRELIQRGGAGAVLPLPAIAPALVELASRISSGSPRRTGPAP